MPTPSRSSVPSSSAAIYFAQELARKNNESAAVHRAYLRRRLRRKSALKSAKPAKIPKKNQDALDWTEAIREARPIRAVGFFLPSPPASSGGNRRPMSRDCR